MSSNTSQDDWVSAFFHTADQCNADLTAEWFAEDIDMRFANHPPVSSRAEARDGLRQFMSNISGMVHERQSRVMEGDAAVQMATVRYTLPAGGTCRCLWRAICGATVSSCLTAFGSISIWRRSSQNNCAAHCIGARQIQRRYDWIAPLQCQPIDFIDLQSSARTFRPRTC